MSKVITVFGATGNQGGSVIKHILDHAQLSKEYKIRAVTRDVSKPRAVALKGKGCELVTADLDDAQSIKKAIDGSNVVFGVTNFWEYNSMDREIKQGHNLVDASKAAGAYLIWSSLPNVTKQTKGDNSAVHHFDSKAEVEEYARSSGIDAAFYMPGIFMSVATDNIKKQDDGSYVWANPWTDPVIPFFDPADDAGLFVAAILLQLDEAKGQRILGCSEATTPSEMIRTFGEVTGAKASTYHISWEQFASYLPKEMAEDLVGNFKLIESPGYYVGEPEGAIAKSREFVRKAGLREPTTWREYLEKNPPK